MREAMAAFLQMLSSMPMAAPIGDSESCPVTIAETPRVRSGPRLHWAWTVAAVSFVTLLAAAGFRSVPSVMMDPLHQEFGWSHGTVGLAMSINMTLFGLTAPFSAALMDRFGVRPILAGALTLIALGTALSVFMTAGWQLLLLCSGAFWWVSAPGRSRWGSWPRSPPAGSSNAADW